MKRVEFVRVPFVGMMVGEPVADWLPVELDIVGTVDDDAVSGGGLVVETVLGSAPSGGFGAVVGAGVGAGVFLSCLRSTGRSRAVTVCRTSARHSSSHR